MPSRCEDCGTKKNVHKYIKYGIIHYLCGKHRKEEIEKEKEIKDKFEKEEKRILGKRN